MDGEEWKRSRATRQNGIGEREESAALLQEIDEALLGGNVKATADPANGGKTFHRNRPAGWLAHRSTHACSQV